MSVSAAGLLSPPSSEAPPVAAAEERAGGVDAFERDPSTLTGFLLPSGLLGLSSLRSTALSSVASSPFSTGFGLPPDLLPLRSSCGVVGAMCWRAELANVRAGEASGSALADERMASLDFANESADRGALAADRLRADARGLRECRSRRCAPASACDRIPSESRECIACSCSVEQRVAAVRCVTGEEIERIRREVE